MGSQARVAANRRNAAKSTGPRTTEGKAVVAQNAVKHGLWARQAVLRNEDPQEFELHRSRMLRKLAPDGPEEEAMAERIVGLWWRLKRAERMQDEALDYLIEADRGSDWVKCRRENRDPSARAELRLRAGGRTRLRRDKDPRPADDARTADREQPVPDDEGAATGPAGGKSGGWARGIEFANLRNHDGWQRQGQACGASDGVGLHPEPWASCACRCHPELNNLGQTQLV